MPNYTFLSTYNNYGLYDNINLDEDGNNIFHTVSSDLLDEVNTELSEGTTVVDKHPDWIKKSDIITTDNCEITLTFVNEGAGYKNALSYYVYDLDDPPTRFHDVEDIYIIFPNASKNGSGGQMNTGDTVQLAYEVLSYTTDNNKRYATSLNYTFPANKGISFVIHANRWQNNGTEQAFLSVGHLMYSSDPVLNPEPTNSLKNHFVNFQSSVEPEKIIYGVEDTLRTRAWCDHDFNDLTFYLTPTPMSAVSPKSYNSTTQQNFKGTILCEDLKNRVNADLDYNDFTMEYEVTENLVDTKITSITIKIQANSRGATLKHDFGVVIPNIKNMSSVKIFREEYITHSDTTTFYDDTASIYNQGTDRVPIIKNTTQFLPHDSTWATNTDTGYPEIVPSYAILRIVFPAGGINRNEINDRYFPYNFYLRVYRDNYYMWDLYSDNEYTDVSSELKGKGISSKKKIFILEDITRFRHPIEKQPLRKAYHKFEKYLVGNMFYQAWYLEKWSREHLLYPAIDHTDSHVWNTLLDKDKEPNRQQLLALSRDNSVDWDETNILSVLESHNLQASSVLDWDDISNDNVEDIIQFIKDFGTLHIKKTGSYIYSSGRMYFISLTSLQTNSSRLVHEQFSGLTETIELLSWTSNYPFFVAKLD